MKAAAPRASRQPTMTEFLRRSHSATRSAPRAAAETGGGSGGCQPPLASGGGGESPASLSSLASFFGRASEVVSPSLTPRLPSVDDNSCSGGGLQPPGCGRVAKRQRLACGRAPERCNSTGDEASAAVAGSCAVSAAARAIAASDEPASSGLRGLCEHSPSATAVAHAQAESSGDDDDLGGVLLNRSSPGGHAATPLRTYSNRRRCGPWTVAPARQPDAVGQSPCDGDEASVKVDVNKENVPSNSADDACGGGDRKQVQENSGDSSVEPSSSDSGMMDSRGRSSAGSSKSPPAAACRALIQMKLDLGQKEMAGDPRLCPRCGMMYTPGDESDELLHRRFHGKAEEALRFPGWKNEDVVLENPDGSRVICIQPSARGHVLAKLKAVQAIMDEELGAHDSNSLLQRGRKAYLYISARSSQQHQQQIKGVCVAEPIACGYRLLGGSGSEAMASDEQEPACCGIYRLWVCRTGRRQGVATCLLNAVRMHCVPGRYVSEDKLAFSDPTELGKLFAASYTRSEQFLIYK